MVERPSSNRPSVGYDPQAQKIFRPGKTALGRTQNSNGKISFSAHVGKQYESLYSKDKGNENWIKREMKLINPANPKAVKTHNFYLSVSEVSKETGLPKETVRSLLKENSETTGVFVKLLKQEAKQYKGYIDRDFMKDTVRNDSLSDIEKYYKLDDGVKFMDGYRGPKSKEHNEARDQIFSKKRSFQRNSIKEILSGAFLEKVKKKTSPDEQAKMKKQALKFLDETGTLVRKPSKKERTERVVEGGKVTFEPTQVAKEWDAVQALKEGLPE